MKRSLHRVCAVQLRYGTLQLKIYRAQRMRRKGERVGSQIDEQNEERNQEQATSRDEHEQRHIQAMKRIEE